VYQKGSAAVKAHAWVPSLYHKGRGGVLYWREEWSVAAPPARAALAQRLHGPSRPLARRSVVVARVTTAGA